MNKVSIEQGLKAFSTSYFKEPLNIDIGKFESQVKKYIFDIKNAVRQGENEEFFKKLINDFMISSFDYSDEYKINTKERIDSAVYSDAKSSKIIHVITEVKSPINKAEMVTTKDINAKALHEIILYYLKETRLITGKKVETNFDAEVKHLIITNSFEWFIFDVIDLENLIKGNIENYYFKFYNGLKESTNNPEFYKFLANELKKINVNKTLKYIYFNIEKYALNKECLVNLYKIFSQDFLIKKKYESKMTVHTLNKKFYHELLYILGFVETKSKENKVLKILINHKVKNTFADQIYQILMEEKEYNAEKAEELTMRLVITWMNRLLFIKLFEGQLLLINGDNEEYHILEKDKIKDFETLYKLFFDVLGKKDRVEDDPVIVKFNSIPYLNSSLFELDDVEKNEGINIKRVSNRVIKIKTDSILKETMKTEGFLLDYLLNFLNSYNFGAEIDENNILKVGKDIIDASVLGLIFEKINGYKDGSYYTQSAITDYIARESINRLIIDKINEHKKWDCKNFGDLIDNFNRTIGEAKEINGIINSIKICDIAVGSGHFLVSAINQIIYVKSELGILLTSDKKDFIKGVKIEIDDGVLVVKDDIGDRIYYKRNDIKSYKIQEMIFEEKRSIIENCIFGVDINPNAVNICRLRLWIELLKSAYYRNNKMETLPNIDINIKCGNSLISKVKFSVGEKISKNNSGTFFTKGLKKYKETIGKYKVSSDKSIKNELKTRILEIKSSIVSSCIYDTTKFIIVNNELQLVENKVQPLFKNSLEWAFEFPEILDENGVFEGFDIIIGNPPYIDSESMSHSMIHEREYYKTEYSVADGNWDIFVLFVERALMLLKENGYISFIVPNKLLHESYASKTRKLMSNKSIMFIRDYSSVDVFPDADIYTIIFCLRNNNKRVNVLVEKMKDLHQVQKSKMVNKKDFYSSDSWGKYINTSNASLEIIERLNKLPRLSDYVIVNDAATVAEAYLIKEKIIDKNTNSSKYLKLINTGTIDPFRCYWGEENITYLGLKYLNPVISSVDLKNISIKRYNESTNEKIAVAGLARRIEAFYDKGEYLIGKSTRLIQKKLNVEINLAYISGLLNSNLLNFYMISVYGTASMSKGYISLKNEMIYNLPILVSPNQNNVKRISALVLDIQNKICNSNNSMKVIKNKIEEMNEIIYSIYNISDIEKKNIEKVIEKY